MSKKRRRQAAVAQTIFPPSVDPALFIDALRLEMRALTSECEGWFECARMKEDKTLVWDVNALRTMRNRHTNRIQMME